MKNLTLVLTLIFLFGVTSIALSQYGDQREKHNEGSIIVDRQFHQIDLYFIQKGEYLVFYRWKLRKSINNRMATSGYGNERRAVPLNPNNQYAVSYNFTHYVETPYGQAYFRAN